MQGWSRVPQQAIYEYISVVRFRRDTDRLRPGPSSETERELTGAPHMCEPTALVLTCLPLRPVSCRSSRVTPLADDAGCAIGYGEI
jgi:hypothetical protein